MNPPIYVPRHRRKTNHTAVLAAAASLAVGLAIAVVTDPSAGADVATDLTTSDAFVASDAPTTVENTSWVSTDAKPSRYGYFKFHVTVPTGTTVTSAVFKCWAGSSNAAGLGVWTTPSTWSETTLTWNGAPLPDLALPPSGSTGPVTKGTWATADVTRAVTTTGDVTLVTRTTSSARWSCASKENGSGGQAAQLVVTTEAAPPTPPTTSPLPTSTSPLPTTTSPLPTSTSPLPTSTSPLPTSTSPLPTSSSTSASPTASRSSSTSSTPPPSSTSTSNPTPTSTSVSPSQTQSGSSSPPPPSGHKVMVIVEENHSESQALGSMPYLASLANQYAQTTAYHAITHPSLPNYLAIAGGDTFGVTDDNGPSSHPIAGDSVFDQSIALGRTAKAYAEAMTTNCQQSSSGTYAVRHNPWAYFNGSAQRANCTAKDVPMGTPTSGNLLSDVKAGTLPDAGIMVPDLCNDAHDCSLGTADGWLQNWIPALMAGPDYTSGNLTVIVTFDEDDSSSGNLVAFVAIDPQLNGAHEVVALNTNHYSLTRWYDSNVAAAPLRNAAGAADLKTAFGL